MMHYAALGASIILNASSLVLMKSFALSSAAVGRRRTARSVVAQLLDVRLIVSVVAYGFAAVFWLIALLGVDLMVAYPSLALTYVIINIVSHRHFGEDVSPARWSGVILIVAGVIVMNL